MNTMQAQTTKKPEDFIAYEYRNIVATRKLASIYVDYFPQFGWELEDSTFNNQLNRVSMTFKRDRQLKSKIEINKLQSQFEQGIEAITHLEGSKNTRASIVAYTVGLIGTAFMAGAVFTFLAGNIIACIILAIPGFLGWGLAYVLYMNLSKKRSVEVIPEIDREFDVLYSACEKAHAILAS